MKKLLLISLLIFALTGCSNDLAKLKTNDTITYNINNGFNADEVLKDIKEGTTIDTKLDEENSKLIITLTNGDITQTLEQAVNIEYPLATLGKETLDINAYNFDPKNILEDLKEGTDVKYELKDNEVVITLTNGEQVDTITRSANISHPLAWFNSTDITIDTYYGYDINELVTTQEGVEITDSLDEEKSILTITAKKDGKEETIETPVTLTNSNPYPITCKSQYSNIPGEDVTGFVSKFISDSEYNKINTITGESNIFSYNKNAMFIYDMWGSVSSNDEYTYSVVSGHKRDGSEIWWTYKCDKPHPFK